MRFPILILFCVMTLSCNKDEDEVKASSEAPSLPPSGSLSLDLTSFSETNLASAGQSLTAQQGNYAIGLVTILAINSGVSQVLTPPKVAIGAALNQTAAQNGDASWTWTYASSPFSVELTGTIASSESTEWAMVVNRDPKDSKGCCTDFTWLTGSIQGLKAGKWTMFDATVPEEEAELFKIEWTLESDTERQLTVTAQKDISATFKKGGSVTYVLADNSITLTVVDDPAAGKSTVVTWDVSTRAGSVKGEGGVKVCWDASKTNVTCSG